MSDPRPLLEEGVTPFEAELLSAGRADALDESQRRRLRVALGVATVAGVTAVAPAVATGAAAGTGAAGSVAGTGAVAAAASGTLAPGAAAGGAAATGTAVSAAMGSKAALLVAAKWIGTTAVAAAVGVGGYQVVRSREVPLLVEPATQRRVAPPVPAIPVEPTPAPLLAELPIEMAPALPRRPPPAGRPSLGDEVASLDAVRAALASRQPKLALQRLERHRRRFVPGRMRSEVEVLHIEALASDGQTARARRMAEVFLAREESRPYRARVLEVLKTLPGSR